MVCCNCMSCGETGFISKLLAFVFSVAFFTHLFGLVTPAWMCDNIAGNTCETYGLFVECVGVQDFDTGATDDAVVALALIVTISSLILNIVYCGIINLTSYSKKPMTPRLGIVIGAWFIVQESVTIATLATVGAKFDKIGWAAFVFSIPGIAAIIIVVIVMVYLFFTRNRPAQPERPTSAGSN